MTRLLEISPESDNSFVFISLSRGRGRARYMYDFQVYFLN